MCELLEVSPGGYYKWLKWQPSAREMGNAILLKRIKKIFEGSKKTYGWRRVHNDFSKEGILCNHKTVAKVMKDNNLTPLRKRKYRSTTDSNHKLPISENVLCRDFNVKWANIAWVSDITYGAPRPLVGVHISGMQTWIKEVEFQQ